MRIVATNILAGILVWAVSPGMPAQVNGISDHIEHRADGNTMEIILNSSVEDVVGFRIAYLCPDGKGMVYDYDSVAYAGNTVLHTNQSKAVFIPPNFVACKGGVNAVIYASGRTQGRPEAIKALDVRRKNLALELTVVQQKLQAVQAGTETLAQVQQEMTTLADEIPLDGSLPDDAKVGRVRALRMALRAIQAERLLRKSAKSPNLQISATDADSTKAMVIAEHLDRLIQAIAKASPIQVPNSHSGV